MSIQRYKPYEDHAGWTHGMDEANDGQYVRFSDYAALAAELAVLKPSKCAADMYSDPPQDCDAPYCGCNPAWSQCIQMLQEIGWQSPDEVRSTEARVKDLEQQVRDAVVLFVHAAPGDGLPDKQTVDLWCEAVKNWLLRNEHMIPVKS